MATEYKYYCDGCNKDVTDIPHTEVETQEREKGHYRKREKWILCKDCVSGIVRALKTIEPGESDD